MKYYSTRNQHNSYSLSEAVAKGLASDGGLFVSDHLPHFDQNDFSQIDLLSNFAYKILKPFFHGDPLEEKLQSICDKTFSFSIPLKFFTDNKGILELYHGPTAAFKDVGARFLANTMENLLDPGDFKTILVATSGDTGSAVASAFHQNKNFKVVILFPLGKVSKRQEHLLSCYGDNVTSIAVEGSFDDCQRMVKETFLNNKISQSLRLSSANSINIGRLLPQCVYYAKASVDYLKHTGRSPSFIVPTGNLGNALAAVLVKEMGFGINKIVFSNNKNAVMENFFNKKRYEARKSVATIANAMDVGAPSNMERLLYYFPNFKDLFNFSLAHTADDEMIRRTIIDVYTQYKLEICPHTATAFQSLEQVDNDNCIVVATAHAAKFSDVVEPLLKKKVHIPESLQELLAKKSSFLKLQANTSQLEKYLFDILSF